MIFTQAFNPFGAPNKKGLFHNNPTFEMVQYPQRRSSTEDLTKITAAKPPTGRPKKRVMRRTNTDPGPLSSDILTILLEQLPNYPKLGSLPKKVNNQDSSKQQSTAPNSVSSTHNTSNSSPVSVSSSSKHSQHSGSHIPTTRAQTYPVSSQSSNSLPSSTGMCSPNIYVYTQAVSNLTPVSMSYSMSSSKSNDSGMVSPPISVPTRQSHSSSQLSSSAPNHSAMMRAHPTLPGSIPSAPAPPRRHGHFHGHTAPSPPSKGPASPPRPQLSPAYGPSPNAPLPWQQEDSKPRVITASSVQHWTPPGSASASVHAPSSLSSVPSSLSKPTITTTTAASSSTSSTTPTYTIDERSLKEWKPAKFKLPPRTSSLKKKNGISFIFSYTHVIAIGN